MSVVVVVLLVFVVFFCFVFFRVCVFVCLMLWAYFTDLCDYEAAYHFELFANVTDRNCVIMPTSGIADGPHRCETLIYHWTSRTEVAISPDLRQYWTDLWDIPVLKWLLFQTFIAKFLFHVVPECEPRSSNLCFHFHQSHLLQSPPRHYETFVKLFNNTFPVFLCSGIKNKIK